MSVECKEIVAYLEELFPTQLAESWDNVGLMVGNRHGQINKVLVALDATAEVVDEAVSLGVDLIVTHHPIIFKPLKNITSDTLGGRLFKLIRNDISVFSAHTNFDIAYGGTNDILAEKLKIRNTQVLEPTMVYNEKEYGIGRIGELENEVSFFDFCNQVKLLLGIDCIRGVGDMNRHIKRVAVCSGSGADYIEAAYKKGSDLYLTGDIKFHEAQRIKELGMLLMDITHYYSENISMPSVKEKLDQKSRKENWNIEIMLSKINGELFKKI